MPFRGVFVRFLDEREQFLVWLSEGAEESALLAKLLRSSRSPLLDVAAIPPAQHVRVIFHRAFHIAAIFIRDCLEALHFQPLDFGVFGCLEGVGVVAIDDRQARLTVQFPQGRVVKVCVERIVLNHQDVTVFGDGV